MKNSFIMKKVRRALYIQLVFSVLLFVISMGLLSRFPGENYFFPRPLNSKSHYENFYNRALPYVTVTVPELSYTGCRYTVNGLTKGYYYYTLNDGFCQFYLLDAPAGSSIPASRSGETLKGRLVKLHPEEYDTLLLYMADDLNWTAASLERMTAPYAVSTLPYPFYLDLVFRLAAGLGAALALSDFLSGLIYLILPYRAPAFRFLGGPEETRLHLAKAELEIKHTVLAQSSSLLLTPGYVISFDTDRPLLLPVSSVLRVKRLPSLLPRVFGRKRFPVLLTTEDGRFCTLTLQKESHMELLSELCHTS